jgi:hypothetical protein
MQRVVEALSLSGKGVDMEAADSSGYKALHHAIDRKQESIALFLIQEGCDVNAPNKVRVIPR